MFIADAIDWQFIAERFGLPMFGLVIVLFTGYKRVWVWGYQLKDAEDRAKDWKDMAIRGTLIAERSSGREKWTIEQRLSFLEQQTVESPPPHTPPS